MTRRSGPEEAASGITAAKQDHCQVTGRRFDVRAYPEVRREKWEREERELLADRIAALVIERLRRAW